MGEIIGLPVNEPERYVDVRQLPTRKRETG
jgi:hypothetical protein